MKTGGCLAYLMASMYPSRGTAVSDPTLLSRGSSRAMGSLDVECFFLFVNWAAAPFILFPSSGIMDLVEC